MQNTWRQLMPREPVPDAPAMGPVNNLLVFKTLLTNRLFKNEAANIKPV